MKKKTGIPIFSQRISQFICICFGFSFFIPLYFFHALEIYQMIIFQSQRLISSKSHLSTQTIWWQQAQYNFTYFHIFMYIYIPYVFIQRSLCCCLFSSFLLFSHFLFCFFLKMIFFCFKQS